MEEICIFFHIDIGSTFETYSKDDKFDIYDLIEEFTYSAFGKELWIRSSYESFRLEPHLFNLSVKTILDSSIAGTFVLRFIYRYSSTQCDSCFFPYSYRCFLLL